MSERVFAWLPVPFAYLLCSDLLESLRTTRAVTTVVLGHQGFRLTSPRWNHNCRIVCWNSGCLPYHPKSRSSLDERIPRKVTCNLHKTTHGSLRQRETTQNFESLIVFISKYTEIIAHFGRSPRLTVFPGS
jgi:hypothetical protein